MRRLFPLALLALACAHAPPSPTRVLDEAAGRAKDADAPPRVVALAAFHALLVDNQPERAGTLAAEALRRDPAEPYALTLQMLLARRDGHPEGSLDAALRLVRGAPRHPLATAAAREIQEMAGVAGSAAAFLLFAWVNYGLWQQWWLALGSYIPVVAAMLSRRDERPKST